MTRVVALPAELYRAKVARTIGLVVHCAFRGQAQERKVVSVFEVTGYHHGGFTGHLLWRRGRDGRLVREIRPECLEAFEDAGVAYDWPGDGVPS
jgi:hypothetical protein